MARLVIGISGASGTILALHLIRAITEQGVDIDLVVTPQALYTARYEIDPEVSTPSKLLRDFDTATRARITIHRASDIGSSISSGSHPTLGMVIIPCSMATCAAIAVGLGDNCLRRAADVTLKEKRPLILVPREAPLSAIHLENLLKLAQLGATIIPPVPSWYTRPKTLTEMELFIVGKVLDALRLPHTLYPRWEGSANAAFH